MRPKAQSRNAEISIIGFGNWGTSLAAALTRAGTPPREIVVRHRKRRQSRTVAWGEAALDARILWLCVPDSAIADAAAEILRRRAGLNGQGLRGQILVHSSGALTVDALKPAHRAGAAVASVHPAMTFPTRRIVPLDGVLFGVEASNPGVRRTLHGLVRRLGGQPFDVASKNKALYHAAGTLASPLLVAELAATIEAARLAGLDRRTAPRWVEALATATARNLFARGPGLSFSGPFARGDSATIRLHLQALQKHPILADLYRSLAVYALDHLPVQNRRALEKALSLPAAPESKQQGAKPPREKLKRRVSRSSRKSQAIAH
ncbi:MAG TPA: DUF2520 domain-containing protein [Silvibacterium sp.]|nr:DUF2520 domain-containing protein [Silvibacterium sp.]